jgi:hypothetical protein
MAATSVVSAQDYPASLDSAKRMGEYSRISDLEKDDPSSVGMRFIVDVH